MGFNKRKMEDQRRQAAEKEAAARRANDAQRYSLRNAPPRRPLALSFHTAFRRRFY
jgi:hypothetical protein